MPSELNKETYRKTIRELSDQIVEAQRPIRILDAIKWDTDVQKQFFESGCKEQPAVDRAYYENRPLAFDPVTKRLEFHELERQVSRRLGQFSPVGVILRRMCHEYRIVVRMLEARGLPEFASYSQQLYGSASDVFHAGDPTLADLGVMMSEALGKIDQKATLPTQEKNITGEEAVAILQERLNQAFPDPDRPIRVMLSDGIVSDAAAGTDYLKIRKEARFNMQDLRLLEVHEGWVHVGTTLNGMSQPVCTFLSKGPPSATITQEGLAIVMEIFAFASHPARLRRVTNRIRAVSLAEEGATFRDVFEFFREPGLRRGRELFQHDARVSGQHAGGRAVYEGHQLQQRLYSDLQLHPPGGPQGAARPDSALVLRQDDVGGHADALAPGGRRRTRPTEILAAAGLGFKCTHGVDVLFQFLKPPRSRPRGSGFRQHSLMRKGAKATEEQRPQSVTQPGCFIASRTRKN